MWVEHHNCKVNWKEEREERKKKSHEEDEQNLMNINKDKQHRNDFMFCERHKIKNYYSTKIFFVSFLHHCLFIICWSHLSQHYVYSHVLRGYLGNCIQPTHFEGSFNKKIRFFMSFNWVMSLSMEIYFWKMIFDVFWCRGLTETIFFWFSTGFR